MVLGNSPKLVPKGEMATNINIGEGNLFFLCIIHVHVSFYLNCKCVVFHVLLMYNYNVNY